jgi:LPS export ABC transporter permease LptF
MRAPRTLYLYILREVLQYTLIGLAAISVVLVTRNLVRMLDWLVGAGFAWRDLLTVLRLLGTMLASYTLPIAFLFGVLLALGRMAGDVEIIAMRACGVGKRQIAAPVLLLAALISIFTWKITLEVEPAAQREMKVLGASMLMRGAIIEPGRFVDIGPRLLYVDERDPDGTLHGIVISDGSNPGHSLMIFAKSADMSLDEEHWSLTLRLHHGDVHLEPPQDPDGLYQRMAFDTFEYELDVRSALGPPENPRAREMSMRELRAAMARVAAGDTKSLREDEPITYALNYYKRIATPLAPLLFGLVGVPIAMRRKRGARSFGALLCALIAFAYYLMLSFSEFMAREGWLPAAPAVWIPNALFAALAWWLLARMRFEGS